MKHSPGPWSPSRQKSCVIRDADKEEVAVVCTSPSSGGNERLIAAAPELLAFLRRYRDARDDGDLGILDEEADLLLAQIDG